MYASPTHSRRSYESWGPALVGRAPECVKADFSRAGERTGGRAGSSLGIEAPVQGAMFWGGVTSEEDVLAETSASWMLVFALGAFLGLGSSSCKALQRAKPTLFRVPLLKIASSDLRTALRAKERLATKSALSLIAGVWASLDDASTFLEPSF